jgi:magnesium chelatase subunit I
LIRALGQLLDEWTPVIAGSELNEHPMHPITPASRRAVAEAGDDLPVAWLHRSMRYGEKLATPDTSVGDLIGDVDPIRVAQGRTLGDPETIHFGLVPRTNRGIFAVNELPDLAERIQVALLNVLEERDIQVRGYQLRLPLDLLLVASANPEDYTNRGRIITPLKDRFGAEIRTHYPLDLDLELDLIRQEAALAATVPDHVLEVLARFARAVRESPAVDPRSGVSARFAIAAAETVSAAALRRAALVGAEERDPVARVGDAVPVTSTLRGKVEFEAGEEGREIEILAHLLRTATADAFRARLAGLDLSGFTALVADGAVIETGELVGSTVLLRQVGTVPGLAKALDRLGLGDAPTPGEAAAGVEFVLEGLHLTRRLAKDISDDGRTRYRGRDGGG